MALTTPAPAGTLALLVPAYNLQPWDRDFVERLGKAFSSLETDWRLKPALIFVDDGSSSPGTELPHHFARLAELGVQVVATRHEVNRGQGAALQTALEIARSPRVNADFFVTFDADGQHDPDDIGRLYEKLVTQRLNIVFGNRFEAVAAGGTGIPASRRGLLFLATAFERALTGLDLGDAHNGLRLFDRTAAGRIELTQDRMAHATEFKTLVRRNGLKYGEAPVRIRYSEESLQGGQRNSEALRILVDLLRGWWIR
ncbi:MAG TPA: glycosyltransferase family 2 protein [Bdellovibrionota bacterium]|nr:glycosyltransferase family 2 protein [Bdellovibrionota bacterium]